MLQESLIILLERGGRQGDVTISACTDDDFADMQTHTHAFARIVSPGDPERFIHVPLHAGHDAIERLGEIRHTLDEVGLAVSTGPVVDFRLREHLRAMPEPGAVPLLYPGHFGNGALHWPRPELKKPNAMRRNADTEKWLYPRGYYCVVRRFSAKEERRRIVAAVIDPDVLGDCEVMGLENHLNVFHQDRHGLPEALARGLTLFLNSTAVDEWFRRFNGHTQVNATDLRSMRYPARQALIALGEWAMIQPDVPTQATLDRQLELVTA